MYPIKIIRLCFLNFAAFGFALLNVNTVSGQSNPEFQSSPVIEATYGSFYQYNIEVFDAEEDALTVELLSGFLPAGIELIPDGLGNYLLEGTPTVTGDFDITLIVYEPLNTTSNSTQSFTLGVSTASQTITFGTLEAKTFGDATFDLTATASSGLGVSYTSSDPTVATISGSTVTLVGAGTATITAIQEGNTNYEAATSVDQTLAVNKADQTITFTTIPDKTYGDLDFELTASSDSGLPVSFSVTSGNATLTGNRLSITGSGDVSIAANQAGNVNYNPATTASQTFTINKALLTVTADNKNSIFGAAIPELTISYAGFVYDENATALITAPTATTTATASSDAGNYPITAAGAVSDNYNFDYVEGNLAIAKADQTINFTAIPNKTYGDLDFELTAASDSGLPVTFSVTSGNATLTGNTLSITGSGDVTIAANQAGNVNYNPAPTVSQTFTINKALLTVTADDKNINYGAAIPDLTLSYSGFVYDENATDLTTLPSVTTTANASSNVGDYSITADGAASDNYSFDYVEGNLAIATADQIISFTTIPNKNYGDLDFELTASSDSGLPVTFSVTSGNATLTGNTLSITGTGDVTIAANQAGDVNYNPATTASQTFTINKALLTVTADNKNSIYGAAIPELTVSYAGFVYDENATALITAPTATTTATASSDAGNYPITAAGAVSDNYNFDYLEGNLAIAKADQIINFITIPNKNYGDLDFELTASSDSGLPVTFSVTSGNATLTGNTLSITGTGDVTIAANQAGDINYNPATTASQTFTINKALLTVTADNKNIIYGAAIPDLTLSYSGFVYDENATDLTTLPSVTTTANASSNVGDYSITADGAASDNYSFNYVEGNLVIAKADQTITFTTIPNKTYGDLDFELTAGSDSGLPVTFSVTSGNATLTGNTLSITGTGDVTIAANQVGDINYNPATTASQTFTINKASLTVTADDKNSIYGAAIPELTVSYAGFVYDENATALITAPTATTTATASSDAGNYPITAAGAVSDNYNFDYVEGNLAIAKADQIINFTTIPNKTYGDLDFELTASSDSGLPVSFSVTNGNATLTGNTLSITGTGDVTIAANQVGDINYNPATTASQTFTINKASLTVTADDKNSIYGAAIPELTISYAGFVYDENATALITAPTATTTATASSDAGNYPITAAGAVSDNYNFDYVEGNLAIAKADQTITFTTIPNKTYGDLDFELTAGSDSGLPVSFSVTSGNATLTGNTLSITGSGDVTIAANQAGNINYNPATPVSRSFTVIKAEAVIQISNTLQNFDGNPKEVAVSIQPEQLNYIITYNGNSIPPSTAGTYTVEINIVDNNYTGQLTSELIINSAPSTSGIPNQQVAEDSDPIQLSLLNYFSDIEDDNSALIFEFINNSNTNIFSNITLTANLLELSFAPNANGTSTLTIRCTDSNGLLIETNFEIAVTPVQDTPFFTSSAVTEVLQDEEYQYLISVEDYDMEDSLSITNIISLPSWLNLNDNGNGTAVLSGLATNNNIGVYGIAIRVSDDKGNTANQFFDIEVIDVNDPPIFTTSPITEAEVNQPYSYSINTQDIDQNDEVSVFVLQKPTWLSFSTQSLPIGSALLQGTPTNEDRNNNQNVILVAVDLREDSSFQNFTIDIDFPNTAPIFTSEPITAARQDENYSYQISLEDTEGDSLYLTTLSLPNWLNFNEEERILTGLPGNSEVGDHNVVLEVEDFFGLKTTQNFIIQVENINDPPTIVSSPDTMAVQNQLYEYRIVTEDIDVNDTVRISVLSKPLWLNFDNEFLLSGNPTLEDVENSPFEVEIQAADIEGANAIQRFDIYVELENTPPTIDSIVNPETINEDTDEIFTINLTGITDGNDNSQEISLNVSSDLPGLFESIYIDYTSPNNTAELIYSILPDSFGIATVTIRVEDNGPSSINFMETSFQIEVSPVNDVPIFTSNPVERAQQNTFYQYNIEATDADPFDELTISKTTGPDWLVLTDNGDGSAVLEGQVPSSTTNEEISISVTDLQNASNTQLFIVRVNEPPVISDFSVQTEEDVTYQFNSQDFNNNYTDSEDDTIDEIKIYFSKGMLQLEGTEITSGDPIRFNEELNLLYSPPKDYFGNIILEWTASDGFVHSEKAEILMVVDTVNDKPILSNIETTVLEFIQGSDPITITESITVSDIDNLTMDTAWVQITENYLPTEDRLFLNVPDIKEINFDFIQSSGLLLITGNASKSDYDLILRSVSYQNINSLSNDIRPKNIRFSLSDGEDQSETISRTVQLSNVLPELDFVNAFTPDGNSVNDTWDFTNLDAFEDVNISVYNTQGVRVFLCTSNDCEWDGKFNQQELPAGTYFYLIKLNNGRRKYEGNVTILR
jgi:gliding motility-associated-like protein